MARLSSSWVSQKEADCYLYCDGSSFNTTVYPKLYAVLGTDTFKKKIPLKQEYQRYLYGFFEECYPGLIKKYMTEQNVTRNEIIDIFNLLPEQGEKYKFREALANGKF